MDGFTASASATLPGSEKGGLSLLHAQKIMFIPFVYVGRLQCSGEPGFTTTCAMI